MSSLREKRRAAFALFALLAVSLVAGFEQGGDNRVRFGVIGDSGTGERPQFEVAERMAEEHARDPIELVLMLGDNLYGRERPEDYEKKFVRPYRILLEAGVPFYATLGNHDEVEQRHFELFNMKGNRYYTFTVGSIAFFALDTNRMDSEQLRWLESSLRSSNDKWKVAFFHHPLYSSAGRHGSQVELRSALEPLFVRFGVDVVFAGHDHLYERVKPQKGITYFTVGGSAKLRRGNLREGGLTAAGFDQDRSFLVAEVEGDFLTFQAISRTGQVVDSGAVPDRKPLETVAVGRM